jgi:hypothetical protein
MMMIQVSGTATAATTAAVSTADIMRTDVPKAPRARNRKALAGPAELVPMRTRADIQHDALCATLRTHVAERPARPLFPAAALRVDEAQRCTRRAGAAASARRAALGCQAPRLLEQRARSRACANKRRRRADASREKATARASGVEHRPVPQHAGTPTRSRRTCAIAWP